MSLSDLGKRLTNGESPSQILSSIPGLQNHAAAFNQMDKMVQKELAKNGSALAASYSAPKGAGAAKKNTDFSSLFSSTDKPIAAGAGGQALEFGKMQAAPKLSEGGDIWHEGYTGTLFDITSQRIDKSRTGVDQLEWSSPMNRALLGLPQK